jgi:hypothetical protein
LETQTTHRKQNNEPLILPYPMNNEQERLEKIMTFVKDTLMTAENRNYKDVSPLLVRHIAYLLKGAKRITRNSVLHQYNCLVIAKKVIMHVESETLTLMSI